MSSQPSYEELVTLVAVQACVIDELRAEVAELKRRLDSDSTDSSQPPSKDSIAAKARRRKDLSSRERSKARKPGGQPGHAANRLLPTDAPDRTEQVAVPADCAGCRASLAGAKDAGTTWAQVWDVLPVVLEKVAYLLPRRRCRCGCTTTAVPPVGQAGTVFYGPNLNAAAVLLAGEGNVPVEKCARLIADLLGVDVSAGFVAKAHARLARRLEAAGFDQAMRDALRAEPVLCGDESPVNLLHKHTDVFGQPLPGTAHAVVVRSVDARLVWYAAINARSSAELAGLKVLDGWNGVLVRDDYAGWHQFDVHLAGVQLCAAHLIRSCKGVLALHPAQQGWAQQVIDILREAEQEVVAARDSGARQLEPSLLARLRERYDRAVNWGFLTNRLREWPKGNHPGHVLAKRLAGRAEQVWLFTRNFAVPWTNNASEQALRGPKRHQAVSGYWHTPTTLSAYCRVRSYLVSARGHGIPPLQAIHHALAGTPWYYSSGSSFGDGF